MRLFLLSVWRWPFTRLRQRDLDQPIHGHRSIAVAGLFSVGVDGIDQPRGIRPEINLGALVVIIGWFNFFRHEIKHTKPLPQFSIHSVHPLAFIVTRFVANNNYLDYLFFLLLHFVTQWINSE